VTALLAALRLAALRLLTDEKYREAP